jgi:hypothetical protein
VVVPNEVEDCVDRQRQSRDEHPAVRTRPPTSIPVSSKEVAAVSRRQIALIAQIADGVPVLALFGRSEAPSHSAIHNHGLKHGT